MHFVSGFTYILPAGLVDSHGILAFRMRVGTMRRGTAHIYSFVHLALQCRRVCILSAVAMHLKWLEKQLVPMVGVGTVGFFIGLFPT